MFNFNLKINEGFTLIELLVVVAIIGILATVVISTVNSARTKAADAAVKSNIARARNAAEFFNEANGNSYANACGALAVNGVDSMNSFVLAAVKATGASNTLTILSDGTGSPVAPSSTVGICSDKDTGYMIVMPLKTQNIISPSSGQDFWCYDTTRGFTKVWDTIASISSVARVCIGT